MISKVINEKEWITLKDASKLTGRSIHALRLLINRKKVDKVKKMQDNGPGYWVIHRDAISQISIEKMDDKFTSQGNLSNTSQGILSDTSQVISIPIEFYTQQQKERDNLFQGMIMYQYKFEELDKQIKLLPAPVEIITEELKKKENKVNELTSQRQEQEARIKELETELAAEKNKSWWEKLWIKR